MFVKPVKGTKPATIQSHIGTTLTPKVSWLKIPVFAAAAFLGLAPMALAENNDSCYGSVTFTSSYLWDNYTIEAPTVIIPSSRKVFDDNPNFVRVFVKVSPDQDLKNLGQIIDDMLRTDVFDPPTPVDGIQAEEQMNKQQAALLELMGYHSTMNGGDPSPDPMDFVHTVSMALRLEEACPDYTVFIDPSPTHVHLDGMSFDPTAVIEHDYLPVDSLADAAKN